MAVYDHRQGKMSKALVDSAVADDSLSIRRTYVFVVFPAES